MIREVGRSLVRTVLRGVGRTASQVQEARPLPVDVLEADDAYLVVFDAPGAEGADVQVRYVDGDVRVRVDRFRPFRESFEMVVPGRGLTLEGRADLPPDAVVDADAATATLTPRGTLQVRLPKDEAAEGSGGESETSAGESEAAADESEGTAESEGADENED